MSLSVINTCDVSNLYVSDVIESLEGQGLQDYSNVLRQNCIDGKSLLGLSNATISNWETDKNTKPKKNVLESENKRDLRIDTIQHVTQTANEMIMYSETNVYHSPANKVSDSTEYVDRLLQKLKPTPSFLYQYKLANNITVKSKGNQPYIPMRLPLDETKSDKKNLRGKINSVYSNFSNIELHKFRWYQKSQPKIRGSVEYDDRGYYSLGWKAKNQEKMVRSSSYDTVSDTRSGYCKNANENTNGNEEQIIEEHFYEDLSETHKTSTEDSPSENHCKKFSSNLISKASCMERLNEIVSSLTLSKNRILNILFGPDSRGRRFKINIKRFSRDGNASVDLAHVAEKTPEQTSIRTKSMYISDGEISEEDEYAVIGSVVEQKRGRRRRGESTLVEVEVTKIDVEEYLEPKPWKPAERLYSNVVDMNKVHVVPDISHYDCLPIRDLTGRKIPEKLTEENRKTSQTSSQSYNGSTSEIKTLATISDFNIEPPERPMETLHRWNEASNITSGKRFSLNMADRPLPVPVENEFYYMEVSRLEAMKLLEGHEDGTFILRPSSQSEHAYTISLVYQNTVFNVGVRRRGDNRLALGYAKNTEQSFLTIKDLIEHHYGEKLILIVEGERIGSTVLKKLEYA